MRISYYIESQCADIPSHNFTQSSFKTSFRKKKMLKLANSHHQGYIFKANLLRGCKDEQVCFKA